MTHISGFRVARQQQNLSPTILPNPPCSRLFKKTRGLRDMRRSNDNKMMFRRGRVTVSMERMQLLKRSLAYMEEVEVGVPQCARALGGAGGLRICRGLGHWCAAGGLGVPLTCCHGSCLAGLCRRCYKTILVISVLRYDVWRPQYKDERCRPVSEEVLKRVCHIVCRKRRLSESAQKHKHWDRIACFV